MECAIVRSKSQIRPDVCCIPVTFRNIWTMTGTCVGYRAVMFEETDAIIRLSSLMFVGDRGPQAG